MNKIDKCKAARDYHTHGCNCAQSILAAFHQEMGLTEDALKLMSPEERMDIEKRIAEEIQKRQEAESALVQEEKKLSPLHDYFREKSVLPKKRPGNDMSIHHEIS